MYIPSLCEMGVHALEVFILIDLFFKLGGSLICVIKTYVGIGLFSPAHGDKQESTYIHHCQVH